MSVQAEPVSVTTPVPPGRESFELAMQALEMLEDEYGARLVGLQLADGEVAFSVTLAVAKVLERAGEFGPGGQDQEPS